MHGEVAIVDGDLSLAEPLVALLLEAYTPHLQRFPAQMAASYRAEITDVATRLSTPGHETIVAMGRGGIAGTVTFLPDAATDVHPWPPGGSVLRLLAVAPSFRGLGIARSLVEACVRRARARNATFLGLHTAPFMTDARRLYEGSGFRRDPAQDFDPYRHYSPGTESPGAATVGALAGLAYVLELVPAAAAQVLLRRELPADPTIARTARRALLEALGPDEAAADAAVLALSEVATNALLHGLPPFQLSASVTGATLRVAVHDTGPGAVAIRHAAADAMSGRGIRTIEALTARWGVQPTATGKAVWFEVPVGE